MDSIRNGNFTSSEIVALTTNGKAKGTFGKPFYTYVEECNMERRLGRSISTEHEARPTTWGNLVEQRAFDLLSTAYSYIGKETITHPYIDNWYGSPDTKEEDSAGDIKCPWTLKSFCQLVDSWHSGGIEAIRENHKDGEKFYWQITSNAILLNKPYGELIVYCPYQAEIQEIKELASSVGDSGADTKWIYWAQDEQLPYIPDGGYYKNLNVFRFPIPQRDKDFLTERVIEGSKLLIPYHVTEA